MTSKTNFAFIVWDMTDIHDRYPVYMISCIPEDQYNYILGLKDKLLEVKFKQQLDAVAISLN